MMSIADVRVEDLGLDLRVANDGTEVRLDSLMLVDIVNELRILEGQTLGKKKAVLQHGSFMAKIREELETLESLGLTGEKNILPSSYINIQNKKQPCYKLNRNGALQMLNSESVLVRHKTIEYIDRLENELEATQVVTNSYMIEDPIKRAEAWIVEQKEKQKLDNQLKIAKPKAEYTDRILTSKSTFSTTQVAKQIGLRSATQLNKILNGLGIQYKQASNWMLYADYVDKGLVEVDTYEYAEQKTTQTMKWTESGKMFIHDLLVEHGIIESGIEVDLIEA